MAIAFVSTSTTVNPASNTVAFDATATNGYLVVQTLKQSSQTVTGVTYNGVAMTQLVTRGGASATETIYLWGLAAPTTGSNNIVVTDSGAGTLVVDVSLYSGAQQTTAVEATGSGAISGTSASVSVTTLTDNAWLVGYFRSDSGSGGFTAGSNTVVRTSSAEGTRQMVDTGADQTPAGSKTMNVTMASATLGGAMAFSLKPVAGSAHTSTLTETITNTDSLIRTASRVLTQTITNTDTLIKTATRTLLETITNSDTFAFLRAQGATLSEVITNTDTFLRSITHVLTETISNLDTLIKTASRSFLETLTNTDTFTYLRTASATLIEVITNADTLTRTATHTLTETVTNTVSLLRTTGRTLSETVTNTDTFLRSITHVLSETITNTATLFINGTAVIWTHIAKANASTWTKITSAAASTWTHITRN